MNATDRAALYLQTVIDGEIALLTEAKKGTRNSTLNKVAYRLGQLVAAGLMTDSAARSGLYAGAVAMGLVEEDGEKSVLATIRSGLNDGAKRPFLWPGDLANDPPPIQAADDWVKRLGFGAEAVFRDLSPVIEDTPTAAAYREELETTGYVEKCIADMYLSPGDALEFENLCARGISGGIMSRFRLGRGAVYDRRAITIPWMRRDRLWTIQYRHMDGKLPKYHWFPGLPTGRIFNGDILLLPPSSRSPRLVVVEGALNCIRLVTEGYFCIGLPALRGWKSAFAPYLQGYNEVIFALDYRAETIVPKIAKDLPFAKFWLGPTDPDEFLQAQGSNAFLLSLKDAMPYDASS